MRNDRTNFWNYRRGTSALAFRNRSDLYAALRIALLLPQPPLLLEEAGEELAAGLGEDAGDDLAAVVEAVVVQEVIERLDRAGFGVGRAVDDGRECGPAGSPRST